MSDLLAALAARVVGDWTTEATHVLRPGLVITGRATFERLGALLVHRTWFDHPDFPDAVAVLGAGEGMHYVDERGVYRHFDAALSADGWVAERAKVGDHFGQRLRCALVSAGELRATAERADDGVTWEHDLAMTYRR